MRASISSSFDEFAWCLALGEIERGRSCPEIASLFPNGASVNAALRAVAEIAKRAGSPRARLRGPLGRGGLTLRRPHLVKNY